MSDTQGQVRVDKWLWAARFFKTRGLASRAVSGGKVSINGQRAKPAKAVAVGDELIIHKGQVEQTVTVLDLSSRRGPAAVAGTLYEESEASIEKREKERRERSLSYAGQSMPARRPGKKDRRKIREFIRKND
ncbi:MAG: RNA-binding protein [Desulfocapsa sp.]|nr:RNA-binding protein [Desulfocapsa sp.]